MIIQEKQLLVEEKLLQIDVIRLHFKSIAIDVPKQPALDADSKHGKEGSLL